MSINKQKFRPDLDISSGQRIIKTDGQRYDFLFPKAESKDTVWIKDGEVMDTIKMIERVVWTYIKDTKQLSELLKQNDTEATLKAIWTFLYHNIQYKLDQDGVEELRRPARAWKDRQTGIDCDCFSIFCSSILCNLGIPHQFRITKYSQTYWQHIYVIVPKPNNQGYWTIDAVLSQFNYEKPFTQKIDYTMSLDGIKIAVLSGFGSDDNNTLPVPYQSTMGGIVMNEAQLLAANDVALQASIFAEDLQGLGILEGEEHLLGSLNETDIEDGIYRYLVATRQSIADNPVLSNVAGYNQKEILQMLDYAIQYWYSDKREIALTHLSNNETLIDQINGFGFLGAYLTDDELFGDDDILMGFAGDDDNYGDADFLGKAKKAAKAKAAPRAKAAPKPKAKEKKAAKKAAAKASPKAKKKGFFKKVGAGLKKVGKGIVRFNPATIAARNGFLLAMKTNVGRMAERLKWAYATPQQAAAQKVDVSKIAQAKNALAKIEKLFTKIGGKPDNLKKAILTSKRARLSGLGELGILPAAAIAAATPILIATLKIMKGSGLVKADEQVDISSTGGDDDEGVSYEEEATNNTTNYPSDDVDYAEELPLEEEYSEGGEESSEGFEGLGNIVTGAIQFAQNNPILGMAIGGAVAFGIYKLMNSDTPKIKAPSTALAGIKSKKITEFRLK